MTIFNHLQKATVYAAAKAAGSGDKAAGKVAIAEARAAAEQNAVKGAEKVVANEGLSRFQQVAAKIGARAEVASERQSLLTRYYKGMVKGEQMEPLKLSGSQKAAVIGAPIAAGYGVYKFSNPEKPNAELTPEQEEAINSLPMPGGDQQLAPLGDAGAAGAPGLGWDAMPMDPAAMGGGQAIDPAMLAAMGGGQAAPGLDPAMMAALSGGKAAPAMDPAMMAALSGGQGAIDPAMLAGGPAAAPGPMVDPAALAAAMGPAAPAAPAADPAALAAPAEAPAAPAAPAAGGEQAVDPAQIQALLGGGQ